MALEVLDRPRSSPELQTASLDVHRTVFAYPQMPACGCECPSCENGYHCGKTSRGCYR